MGDQIGEAVKGTLYYIPQPEFQRIRSADLSKEKRATIIADMCRLNTLYMIAKAGSGQIGSSFSSMEIFSWLLTEELHLDVNVKNSQDIFFSSKGHDAPGYYAVQIAMGRLPFDFIHRLRRINGLPGHPDIGTPGVFTNTGSLGMGISKAKGMVLANRLQKKDGRVFVLTGDGELQEGQFWESLGFAVNNGLHEITVIIDHNKLQSDTFVENVSDLGDLELKLKSFGWCVRRCDGNDILSLSSTLEELQAETRPKIIIADTIKGKGVSFMEHTSMDSDVDMYRFHSGAPDEESYRKAANEIIDRINKHFKAINLSEPAIETIERSHDVSPQDSLQRLIPSYAKALLVEAERHANIVALDADLILDTGLIPFRDRYPDRFIECGIAEQDMVSMAGGMALRGLLPVVHSFACFLSTRPNEQIYNNATEKTKIIYVGSLAGAIPGGPGHSHQSVRDVSALAAIPGLTILEPSCEEEVGPLFSWCVNHAKESCYIRLVSIPCAIPFEFPTNYIPQRGFGVTLKDGKDAVIFAAGPVSLRSAILAAQDLEKIGISLKVVNMPWLNYIDPCWLQDCITGFPNIFVLDNHYRIGGLADAMALALEKSSISPNKLTRIGVSAIPPSGTNNEVLESLAIDPKSIYNLMSQACLNIGLITKE